MDAQLQLQSEATQQENVTPEEINQEPENDIYDNIVDLIDGDSEGEGAQPSADGPTGEQEGEPQPATPEANKQEPQPLEAPAVWSATDKEMFASAPRATQEFLLRRHKDMESDYTRKTQAVSEKERALAGLEGFGRQLQDPAFRNHVQQFFQQPQPAAQPEETPPEDPRRS